MDQIEATTPSESDDAGRRSARRALRTAGIVFAALILLAVIVAAFYGLVSHPLLTASIRDISIILLALVTIIIGLLLGLLMFQLQSLTALLRDEIKPILESVNETTSTVRGTTTFVSDAVVTPLITAASYSSAIRQTVKLLFGGNRRGSPKNPKHRSDAEAE